MLGKEFKAVDLDAGSSHGSRGVAHVIGLGLGERAGYKSALPC